MTEVEIIDWLEREKQAKLNVLQANGGRGVDLANEIDRLSHALDALQGVLFCVHCESQLTGH